MAYPRNIDHVVFGHYDIVTWFCSPYPDDFIATAGILSKLFVCPRCFKYTPDETAAAGHQVRLLLAFTNPARHYAINEGNIQVALYTRRTKFRYISWMVERTR